MATSSKTQQQDASRPMSGGGNVDQVRERVLQLARRIESLSREAVPPDAFFSEFINLVVTAVGARAGAVWLMNGGKIGAIAEVGLDETGLKEEPGAWQKNQKILMDVLSTG